MTRNHLARKTFVVTSVAVLTVAGFVALWKLKVLVALLFLSFMLASAMRPGVEKLTRFRVPKIGGVLAHYAVVAGLIGLFLWLVVPNLLHQVEHAIGNVPQTRHQLKQAANHSTGIKHDILVGLQNELKKLPKAGSVVHASIDAGRKAVEILVGIFFVLAAAAYWIHERERGEELIVSLLPKARRKTVKDTWDLVELKLGAYVRASLLLIGFVGTVLSFAFWAIGLPYWLLLGSLAAILEIIPVIGPLLAGIASIGVALTVSLEAAVLTAIAVYGLRLLQQRGNRSARRARRRHGGRAPPRRRVRAARGTACSLGGHARRRARPRQAAGHGGGADRAARQRQPRGVPARNGAQGTARHSFENAQIRTFAEPLTIDKAENEVSLERVVRDPPSSRASRHLFALGPAEVT